MKERLLRFLRTAWEQHPGLLGLLAAHGVLSGLVWFSGSLFGTYALECQSGAIAWDSMRGLNPYLSLLDYYDRWTGGYLTTGLIAAPFTLLPWNPIYAVKLAGLLIGWGVIGLGYLLIDRHAGRRPALLGAGLLTFCPPMLWVYSLWSANYHYSELVFDLGMAVLVCEVALRPQRADGSAPGRRSWRWYLALGLTCGWAITNCFGSLPYLAVTLTLWWAFDKGSLLGHRAWVAVAGGVLGGAPFWMKVFFHSPYGRGSASDSSPYPDVGGLGQMADKALSLFVRDLAPNLNFGDTLTQVVGPALSQRVAWLWLAPCYVALVGTMWLSRKGLWALCRRLLPMAAPPPTREEARQLALALPALFALSFVAVYALSDQRAMVLDLTLSQFRATRFLPPLIALLALNVGCFLALLKGRLQASRATLWTGVALAGVCAISQLQTIDLPGLLQTRGIPYRGRCYDVEGFYAGPFFRGEHGRMAGLCQGFPEDAQAACYRGYAWSIGHYFDMRGAFDGELDRETTGLCRSLEQPFTRDCFRMVGWSMTHLFFADYRRVAASCRRMLEGEEADWCVEGIGFELGDHYGWAPWKLRYLMPADETTHEDRALAISGVGYLLAHNFRLRHRAEQICARYGELEEGFEAACLEGLEVGYSIDQLPFPPPGRP